jgi:2-keto-4-pentenoate hydratase/2-oxohepta-3-ene-1,7-dioic acid hydratase in catechol pathway
VRLSTIELDGAEVAAVQIADGRLAPVPSLAGDLPPTLRGLIDGGLDAEVRAHLGARAEELADAALVDPMEARYGPLYRDPAKIWGIGLNYRSHAQDLSETHPTEPASFIKANHTIIGPDDPIVLPRQSAHVTAEAELGLVIGAECRDVDEGEALRYLVGVCPILDQTAVDILQRNPRFLTRSKNFPTFFSFGPVLVTMDEVIEGGSLRHIVVGTYRNGEVHREDVVANMAHGPEQLISLHSQMMPLHPGDIISPGSPGAVRVEDGDVVECRIPGVATLRNPVVRTDPFEAAAVSG